MGQRTSSVQDPDKYARNVVHSVEPYHPRLDLCCSLWPSSSSLRSCFCLVWGVHSQPSIHVPRLLERLLFRRSTCTACNILLLLTSPADARACLKSFPFNETLRQNVLTNIARVFDFFTFEEYYLRSPPPFQESTLNIRETLARINRTKYAVCRSCLMHDPPHIVLITRGVPNRPITTSTSYHCQFERFSRLTISDSGPL